MILTKSEKRKYLLKIKLGHIQFFNCEANFSVDGEIKEYETFVLGLDIGDACSIVSSYIAGNWHISEKDILLRANQVSFCMRELK